MRARGPALVAMAVLAIAAACGEGGGGGDPVARGRALFEGEATCAVCHGPDLGGTPMGPPLVNELYNPRHHPDDAIRRAVRNGVQPHHWDFGPMPPLSHLGDDDIDALIAYIRSQQEANGIR
jgi:mono/diheme cytochrome c family protein